MFQLCLEHHLSFFMSTLNFVNGCLQIYLVSKTLLEAHGWPGPKGSRGPKGYKGEPVLGIGIGVVPGRKGTKGLPGPKGVRGPPGVLCSLESKCHLFLQEYSNQK